MLSKIGTMGLLLLVLPAVTWAQNDLDTSTFDQSVRPQDDMFLYVNGSWLKNTPIPADKSNYGSFTKLADESQKQIRAMIEELASTSNPQGSDAQKVGDFYKSFMDQDRINELGLKPIQAELEKIEGLNSKGDLVKYFGEIQQTGSSSPIGFFVMQDAKDSTRYMTHLIQSGTTLPDRDYYLKDDEKSKNARAALANYIQQLYSLAGLPDGEKWSKKIVDLETQLAEIQWERTQLRDAEKRYNKKTMAELAELTPGFDWQAFLSQTGAKQMPDINVMTPSFFEGFDKIFNETPLETWVQYQKFKTLDAYAPYLSQPFVDAHFTLYQKEIAGIPELQPRWKRGVNLVAGAGTGFGALGDAVGKLYVAEHFKPEAKAKMDALVQNLLKAFDQSIDDLTWMTDVTKKRAKEKLAKINTKIGYTDKWRDYSDLTVDPTDLVGNIRSSEKTEYFRMVNKLGKPVDRQEWGMTPQTVNAYYNPSLNEIVFPAAILQSPFFNPDAEMALNYGGIGAVIGHEISHAFDDQGSRFDGDGNMVNWWTDKDRSAFKDLTTQLIAQYGNYQPLEGKSVNGQLTLGENIADLSGLTIAHKALRMGLGDKEPEKVAGWTSDQLFFVGWSRVWARKYRDAEMVKRLLTDSHSPSQYRANGPVTNIDAFYEAFELKDGDKLFKPKEERIKIW